MIEMTPDRTLLIKLLKIAPAEVVVQVWKDQALFSRNVTATMASLGAVLPAEEARAFFIELVQHASKDWSVPRGLISNAYCTPQYRSLVTSSAGQAIVDLFVWPQQPEPTADRCQTAIAVLDAVARAETDANRASVLLAEVAVLARSIGAWGMFTYNTTDQLARVLEVFPKQHTDFFRAVARLLLDTVRPAAQEKDDED